MITTRDFCTDKWKSLKVDSDGILVCPLCGEIHTHQGVVEIFERADDAITGIHITSKKSKATIDTDVSNNPSYRRNGLTIQFFCEICGGTFGLSIAQHKGLTMMFVQ